MSSIKKTALLSTILTYCGFAIGGINVYFFINKYFFSPEVYGLTRIFIDMSMLITSVACLGSLETFRKFCIVYKKNSITKYNDSELAGIMFMVSGIGFGIVLLVSYWAYPLLYKMFSQRSHLFIEYFSYLFLYGFGWTLNNLVYNYMYMNEQLTQASFFRDVFNRFLTLADILLFVTNVIDTKTFIILYAFNPLINSIICWIYLLKIKKIHLSFKISPLTLKLKKRLIIFSASQLGIYFFFVLANSLDSIIITSVSKNGLADLGIFSFANYLVSFLDVATNNLTNSTFLKLNAAYRNKEWQKINSIYKKSASLLLIFAIIVLGNLYLNFSYAMSLLPINTAYVSAVNIILLMGFSRLIDMAFGLNGVILMVSKYWSFDLYSRIILLIIALPSNYFLVKYFGVIGAAWSNVVQMLIYNILRWAFVFNKLKLQPLGWHTVKIILITAGLILSLQMINFLSLSPITHIIVNILIFNVLFVWLLVKTKVEEDFTHLVNVVLKKIKIQYTFK